MLNNKNMKTKMMVVCLFVAFLITGLSALSVHGDDDAGTEVVEVRLIGGQPRIVNGSQAMVPAIFHEIFINTEGSTAKLTFSNDSTPGETKENHYIFSFDGTSWNDTLYNHFIMPNRCSSTPEGITFVVGLNSTANTGLWRLVVEVDGNEVFDGEILVEPYLFKYSLGRLDTFRFRVTPYELDEKELLTSTEYVILYNRGNVPFNLHPDFGAWDNIFNATNTTGVVYPGEERNLVIQLDPARWSPRIIDISSMFTAEVPNMVSEEAQVALNSSFAMTLRILVEVRLAGYDIFDLGTMVMQYIRGPETIEYQEEKTLSIFLTGTDDMVLTLGTESITLVRVEWGGVVQEGPISISLSEDFPVRLNITVRGDFSNSQGWLTYNLTNVAGNISGERSTEFQTGLAPPTPQEPGERNRMALIAIGAGVGLFLGILAVYMMKKRREMGAEADDVEEKVEKKEKSRKDE